MHSFLIPISAPQARQADRYGPKASNLAVLGHAGLPIPESYCLGADAYYFQLKALGLDETARKVFSPDHGARARRHALDMRLGLMDRPIAPEILEPLLAARRHIM